MGKIAMLVYRFLSIETMFIKVKILHINTSKYKQLKTKRLVEALMQATIE